MYPPIFRFDFKMKSRTRKTVSDGSKPVADRRELTTGNYCVGPPSICDRGQVNYAGGSGQSSVKGGGENLTV